MRLPAAAAAASNAKMPSVRAGDSEAEVGEERGRTREVGHESKDGDKRAASELAQQRSLGDDGTRDTQPPPSPPLLRVRVPTFCCACTSVCVSMCLSEAAAVAEPVRLCTTINTSSSASNTQPCQSPVTGQHIL